MVGAIASVPVRMLICDDLNVVRYNPLQAITIEVSYGGDRLINILNNVGYAQGQEKYVRLFRMGSPAGALLAFYFLDEMPFYGVYVVYWPNVD